MKRIIFVLLIFLTLDGFSQSGRKSMYCSFAVFYDQDYSLEMIGLKSLNKDRNYTMGLGLYYSAPCLKHSFLMTPHYALNRVVGKATLNDRPDNHLSIINALMLGNGTFTPEDLSVSTVVNNDRPYGSLSYIQTLIMKIDQRCYRHYTSTFTAGVIGSFISREVQTAIHKSMNDGDTHNPRTPRGWNNQISNGGELTLGYTYDEQRLLHGKVKEGSIIRNRFGLELKHGWKYSIGYYTMADYGFNFRFGKIDPRNWTYLVNPLGGSNNLTQEAMKMDGAVTSLENETLGMGHEKKTWELYTFGSLRPTFILYNALLNGQFRKSEYTLRFQDMRHLVLEFNGGIAFGVPFCDSNLLEIKAMLNGRSPEFELPGRTPRWHYWGGLHLIFSHAP